MQLRMRQICLVASDLAKAQEDLTSVFGLEVCYRDAGVSAFGLHNFLLPVGNQFLEVVAPTREGTAAGRYIDRRGGDGGYMVIMQCGDVQASRQRMLDQGVRLVMDGTGQGGDSIGIQLHPKDLPGAIVELRWNAGDDDPGGPWRPAGGDWHKARHTDVISALTAAELQTDNPAALASRWSQVLDRPVSRDSDDNQQIVLDDAVLRFVSAEDGRGEGLGGLDVAVVDRNRLLRAAEARGCRVSADLVMVCGTRFRLV
jgi:hypothetical protein